ncbi:MAG: hypothetical protein JJU28_06480 [Cyclobacteriaceae bacterium]|nr:hypothetical protein [Cyclobacteriaceae bacterium]
MDNWISHELLPEKTNSGTYQVFLGIDATKELMDAFGNRLLARLNDLHEFHCAINLKKDHTSYIHIGKTFFWQG